MKRFFNALWPMAVAAIVTHIVMVMVLGGILYTVACAMVGQKYAMLPYSLFIFAVQVGAILIVWWVRKPRDAEARREYLKELGGEVYVRKTDRRLVSRDKTFRAELIAYAVTALVQISSAFSIGVIIYGPIAYVIFHIFNRWLWMKLHRTWADERMRLNPNG